MEIKEFADRFINAEVKFFETGRFEPLEEIEDPNVVLHLSPGDVVGRDAHKQFNLDLINATSSAQIQWKYVTGDGNLFALRGKLDLVPKRDVLGLAGVTGKHISIDFFSLFRVKNGKIVEGWDTTSSLVVS